MYLLLHPFPHVQGYISWRLHHMWQSPIPLQHLNFSQEVYALSILLSIYLYFRDEINCLISRSFRDLWAFLLSEFLVTSELISVSELNVISELQYVPTISDLDLYELWAKKKVYLDPWAVLSTSVKSSLPVSTSLTFQLSLLRSDFTLLGEYSLPISLNITYDSRSILRISAYSDISFWCT
jgi:hypothetical protein